MYVCMDTQIDIDACMYVCMYIRMHVQISMVPSPGSSGGGAIGPRLLLQCSVTGLVWVRIGSSKDTLKGQ